MLKGTDIICLVLLVGVLVGGVYLIVAKNAPPIIKAEAKDVFANSVELAPLRYGESGLTYTKVYRVVDKEYGVICYASHRGLFCIKLDELEEGVE